MKRKNKKRNNLQRGYACIHNNRIKILMLKIEETQIASMIFKHLEIILFLLNDISIICVF